MSLAVADSSKFVGALKPTFTQEQAEQLFRALSLTGREPSQGQAATGLEIKELELKIEEARESTRREIKELELKIEESRESTRREIKELELKIEEARKEIKELEKSIRKEIKELDLKIEASRESTRKEIKELEQATRKEIKELEQSIRKEIKELDLKIEESRKEVKELGKTVKGFEVRLAETKSETLKWTVGFLLAQTGVIAALMKILQVV